MRRILIISSFMLLASGCQKHQSDVAEIRIEVEQLRKDVVSLQQEVAGHKQFQMQILGAVLDDHWITEETRDAQKFQALMLTRLARR